MKCANCLYENIQDAATCVNCGKALVAARPDSLQPKRAATSGEKLFISIAFIIGVLLVGILTGSVAIQAIGGLLILTYFGGQVFLRHLSGEKTTQELRAEVVKGETKEAYQLRKITKIRDEISQLETHGGDIQEIWKLHVQVAVNYEQAFTQSWIWFDKIVDGNFDLLAKYNEELLWLKRQAINDKDRLWTEKHLKRLQKKIDKWRTRVAEIIANPTLLEKIKKNYPQDMEKHYPVSGFDPKDYQMRLNKAFSDRPE